MRLLSLPLSTLLPLLALLTPISASSCSLVRVEKESYDFSALDGEHSVSTITDSPAGTVNTTYTLNPCQALRPSKDTPKSLQCPKGTWVCGIEYMGDTEEPVLIPIAGSDVLNGHKAIDLKWSLLSSSPSNKDSEREGVRLEMHGGLFPQKGSKGIKQEAVIEFICDLERTGLEDSARSFTVRAADDREDEGEEEEEKPFDDEDPDEGDDEGTDDPVDNEPEVGSDKDRSLRFISYGNRKGGKVLRLEWRTKHACRGHRDEQKEANKKGHWGGFTWFIIILFLATAAYLIFGSWLNYNRYGARGWDLLPHGDTIRDVPYLMKDWTRRVVSTVQGGGSRGGYSAV